MKFIESEIRGYHVYGSTWKPANGNLVWTVWELEGLHDVYIQMYRNFKLEQ